MASAALPYALIPAQPCADMRSSTRNRTSRSPVCAAQGVTMTGILAKACAVALAQHPMLNACEWRGLLCVLPAVLSMLHLRATR